MPLTLAPAAGDAIDLAELIDALEASHCDLADPAALAGFAPLLGRLARNRDFLAELAMRELEQGFAGQRANAYGAQSLLLRPNRGRYLIRANFWPALADAATRAAGPAAFLYDMPHDHNFSFLTVGYLGPGYWSDYYELDVAPTGVPGAPAGLRFVERSRLAEGRVLLYRAHRDVHCQRAPDAFSVSLNILGYQPAQQWRSQYRFDLKHDTVAEALTVAPAEALVAVAAYLGGAAGRGLTTELAARHPHPRMRVTALAALAATAADAATRAAGWAAATDDADPLVAAHARAAIDRIEYGATGFRSEAAALA